MRTLLAATLLIFVVAACGSTQTPSPASSASAQPGSSAASAAPGASSDATGSETPSPSDAASAPATVKPTPKPTPKPIAVCQAPQLAAKVIGWQGAAGSQIATVRLTNTASATCTVQGTPRVQLVAASGAILIDSKSAGASGLPHIAPGAQAFHLAHNGYVTTQVMASNYCGAAPKLPTTVAFILPSNAGRLVAAPGPGGSTPPCNGAPGSLGTIGMSGWTS
jgi:hypothetical protein